MARQLTETDIEQLSAYLDGALTAGERAALEARLKTETDLRAELDTLRATISLVQALPRLKAPRDFTLAAAPARQPSRLLLLTTSPAFSAVSAFAAALLLIFGLLTLFTDSAPQTAPQAGAIAAQPTVLSAETAPPASKMALSPAPETAAARAAEPGVFALEAAPAEVDPLLDAAPPAAPAASAGAVEAPAAAAEAMMPLASQSQPDSTSASLSQADTSENAAADTTIGAAALAATATADAPALLFAVPLETPTAATTATPTAAPTATPAPSPTPAPAAPAFTGDAAGPAALLLGMALLLVALVSTLLRRRGRV